jgi:hypothetical protein
MVTIEYIIFNNIFEATLINNKEIFGNWEPSIEIGWISW